MEKFIKTGAALTVVVNNQELEIPSEVIESSVLIQRHSDVTFFNGSGNFAEHMSFLDLSYLLVKIVVWPLREIISIKKFGFFKYVIVIIPSPNKPKVNFDRAMLLPQVPRPYIVKWKYSEGKTEGKSDIIIIEGKNLESTSYNTKKILMDVMGFTPTPEEEILKYFNDFSYQFQYFHRIWLIAIPSNMNIYENLADLRKLVKWCGNHDPILINRKGKNGEGERPKKGEILNYQRSPNHINNEISTSDYKKLISTGDSLVEKEKYKEASDKYLNAIEILDLIISRDQSNLNEHIEKFELIEKMHPTIAKKLIPILIKKKLKFLRNTKKKLTLIKTCIFCGAELNDTENYCPKCGKETKSELALVVNKLKKDIFETTWNWDFLVDFIDTDLTNAKNLIIYKKQIKNVSSEFIFPMFEYKFYSKIVLKILQFTNTIQKINHPEVLTNSSVLRVHDLLIGNKDFDDTPLKNPWGLFKYEESNFPELELDNAIIETRKDVTITYKDARPDFDYNAYFWGKNYNETEEMYDVALTNPQCLAFFYGYVIQNKVAFYFTKIKNGMTQFTVYLLESKKIKL